MSGSWGDTPAYSVDTGTHYENFDALLAAETNGWCAVAIMAEDQKRRTVTFCRVYGPFPEKRLAKNKAISLRNKFRRAAERGEIEQRTRLVTVTVEPAWKQ